jgi:NADH-quinone oxidoreductase subunit N
MGTLAEKVATLWPEIIMMLGAVACLFTGLAPNPGVRKLTGVICGLTLIVAASLVGVAGSTTSGVGLGEMAPFVKYATLGVGFILLLVAAGVPENLRQVRDTERARAFEPANNLRGEFFAFFLMSLTGVMLTAGADDLAWLFLALELTSLPTYVLVATSRDRIAAQESAVKYFFLGAMGAAIFLYGFALIYGATGYTDFAGIARVAQSGEPTPLLLAGIMLGVVGICFKIAAVPMHFYTADVYQGASTSVTAFLAFVPKTAGFAALILVLGFVGWPLPQPLAVLLWIIAALTMTVGNVLGLLQDNVKRVLAYSSIAHSGYILVGLLAGNAALVSGGAADAGVLANGLAGVLFYLVAYAMGTIASFAVLGCLQKRGDEAQTFDDISGLIKRHPDLAGIMVVSVLSLIGLPPLVGFLGKIYLIGPAYHAGYVWLVVITVLNSAISAAYYLRIANACVFGAPTEEGVTLAPFAARRVGAGVAALLAIAMGFGIGGKSLVAGANDATVRGPAKQNVETGTETRPADHVAQRD